MATLELWVRGSQGDAHIHTSYTGTRPGLHHNRGVNLWGMRGRARCQLPYHTCSHRRGGAGDSKRRGHRYEHSPTPTESTRG